MDTPEHIRDWDFYVDIGDFIRGDQVWTSEDHYLDLIVQTGRSVELLDVDELLEANTAGILDPANSLAEIVARHDVGSSITVHIPRSRVARAAFPKGNAYMRMRDELGVLYEDAAFAALFPAVAPATPPETGASIMARPRAWASAATF